jgi:hypothetical protein
MNRFIVGTPIYFGTREAIRSRPCSERYSQSRRHRARSSREKWRHIAALLRLLIPFPIK